VGADSAEDDLAAAALTRRASRGALSRKGRGEAEDNLTAAALTRRASRGTLSRKGRGEEGRRHVVRYAAPETAGARFAAGDDRRGA
jgi:hypothetical protein